MQGNSSNECVQDVVLLCVVLFQQKHVKNGMGRHEKVKPYTRLRRRHRQKGGKRKDQGNLQHHVQKTLCICFTAKVKKGFVQQPCYTDPCSPSFSRKLEMLF